MPKKIPEPDPRRGLKVLCAACGRDVTYDSHQWRHEPDGRWVCCLCMAPTRMLRERAKDRTIEAGGGVAESR